MKAILNCFILLHLLQYSQSSRILLEDASKTSKHIFFCSGAGSASHIRPLLEYGIELKNKGHRVTVGLLSEYMTLAKPYGLETFVVTEKANPLSEADMESWMKLGFGVRSLVEFASTQVGPFDAHLYKGLLPWFQKQNLSGTLPDVMVGDLAAAPCFELANDYNIPAIVASHFLGFGGGYNPPNINNRWNFEPTSLTQLPLLQRFYRVVGELLVNTPLFIQADRTFDEARVRQGLQKRNAKMFELCAGLPMIGNTFFPFNPVALYPPYYKAVGPIMPRFKADLPENMKEDLDRFSSKGQHVVLVTFGSKMKINRAFVDPILRGLEKALNKGVVHRVYWSVGKTSRDVLQTSNDNIKLLDWVPQLAMLQHPALSLIITHGGAETLHEAMHSGVSIFAIPIYADQPGNAMRVQELGIGKAFNRFNVTADIIYNNTKEVIEDRKGLYTKNVVQIHEVAKRASVKGLVEAVDMIETVALIGSSYLFPDDMEESWFIVNNVDVYLLSMALVVAVLHVMCKALKCVFHGCCSSGRKSKSKESLKKLQ